MSCYNPILAFLASHLRIKSDLPEIKLSLCDKISTVRILGQSLDNDVELPVLVVSVADAIINVDREYVTKCTLTRAASRPYCEVLDHGIGSLPVKLKEHALKPLLRYDRPFSHVVRQGTIGFLTVGHPWTRRNRSFCHVQFAGFSVSCLFVSNQIPPIQHLLPIYSRNLGGKKIGAAPGLERDSTMIEMVLVRLASLRVVRKTRARWLMGGTGLRACPVFPESRSKNFLHPHVRVWLLPLDFLQSISCSGFFWLILARLRDYISFVIILSYVLLLYTKLVLRYTSFMCRYNIILL